MYIAMSYSSAGRRVWNTHGVDSQLSAMTLKPASASFGIRNSWVLSRRVLPVLTIQSISGTLPLASAQKPSAFFVQPASVRICSGAVGIVGVREHRIAVRAGSDRAALQQRQALRERRVDLLVRRPRCRSTSRTPHGSRRPRRRTNGSRRACSSSSCWKYRPSYEPPPSAAKSMFGSASSWSRPV